MLNAQWHQDKVERPILLLKLCCAYNRPFIPLWANATKHRRWGSDRITPEMKSFALTEGSVNVGDSKGSSGIQSMTWVHGKLINTANPLDLFQLTVPARTMWDMQLTKASGWLTPHPPVSLPASLGSESNSTADICALTIWGLWVWCIAGLLSLFCNYWDGLLLLGELVQGLT